MTGNRQIANTLIYLTLSLGYMPFFSPLPIGTDVQPVFFMLAALVLIAKIKLDSVSRVEIALILLSFFSLFYFSGLSDWSPMIAVRFLFAAIAYSFFLHFTHKINQKLILFISILHFLMILFHFLSPSAFIATFGNFVRVIKIDYIAVRGASGLAAEPGFAGALAVVLLASSMFLKDFRGESRYFLYIFVLAIVSIALTRSGTGTLLLGLFVAFRFFRFNLKSLAFAGLFVLVGSYILFNVELGRGASSLIFLIQNPQLALLHDVSMGARVLNFFIGIQSVLASPFGYGIGSYDAVAPLIARNTDLMELFSGDVTQISAFGTMSVELGIFFWLLLVLLFAKAFYVNGIKAIPYAFISMYFLGTSFSFAFPPTWFFLAAMHTNWSPVNNPQRFDTTR